MTASTILQDPDLLITEGLEDVSREEMAEAGLSAFFTIVKEWGHSNDEARTLLGNPSRSRFYELRRGDPGAGPISGCPRTR